MTQARRPRHFVTHVDDVLAEGAVADCRPAERPQLPPVGRCDSCYIGASRFESGLVAHRSAKQAISLAMRSARR